MVNDKLKKIFFVIVIYYVLYLTAIAFHSTFWGDILSPIGPALSFSIIFYHFTKVDRSQSTKINWFLLSLACLWWFIADTIWAFLELGLKYTPNESTASMMFYLGTNIFMLAAIIIYAIYNFRTWSAIQLIVDILAISASALFFFWIVFLNKNFESFNGIINEGWSTSATIFTDITALIGIMIWYHSIRSGKIQPYLRVVASSIALFYVADLYWYYLYVGHQYEGNSLIDAIYVASLLGLAIGVQLQANTAEAFPLETHKYSNQGPQKRSLFLLLLPVLAIMLKGFVLTDLLLFLFVFLIYQTLTIYIQQAIREHALNIELEGHIASRTKELVEKNKLLDYLSNQDTITNLFNRRYFIKTLEKMVGGLTTGETLALLYIDIDRFKTINDTYGHHVGDQVLIEISRRILSMRPENGLLSRLGGDEFVLAAYTNYGYKKMEELAQHIIEECNKIIYVGPYSFQLTVSIGISVYPLDSASSNMLLKNADMAMYQAKKQAYNRFLSFNNELNETIQRKNSIEMLLKQADFDKEFMLYYQPQFSVTEKKLIGMEALLRWNCPGIGMIPPAEFIPIAEEMDYIIPIGDWVMKKAIRQINNWNRAYEANYKMGINVSPKQLDQTGFIRGMKTFMRKYSVDPKWVDVELTEGVAMGQSNHISDITRQFKNAGVSISIDDFGTGYSSLANLKLFPFDRIKIAKPLIDAITSDDYDLHITKFTILLAKSIGIKTIAEGVETAEQFQVLSELGCEQIQGYFLGRPVPAEEFETSFLLEPEQVDRIEVGTHTIFHKEFMHIIAVEQGSGE